MPIKWQPFFPFPFSAVLALPLCCSVHSVVFVHLFVSIQFFLCTPTKLPHFKWYIPRLRISVNIWDYIRNFSASIRRTFRITYVHGCWQYILDDVNTNANITMDGNPREWWKHHCDCGQPNSLWRHELSISNLCQKFRGFSINWFSFRHSQFTLYYTYTCRCQLYKLDIIHKLTYGTEAPFRNASDVSSLLLLLPFRVFTFSSATHLFYFLVIHFHLVLHITNNNMVVMVRARAVVCTVVWCTFTMCQMCVFVLHIVHTELTNNNTKMIIYFSKQLQIRREFYHIYTHFNVFRYNFLSPNVKHTQQHDRKMCRHFLEKTKTREREKIENIRSHSNSVCFGHSRSREKWVSKEWDDGIEILYVQKAESHKSRAFSFCLNFEPITMPFVLRGYTLEHWANISTSSNPKFKLKLQFEYTKHRQNHKSI